MRRHVMLPTVPARGVAGQVGGVVAALLLSMLAVVVPATSAAAADKDCGDFATQKDAQDYFISKGGPTYDPDQLDADGDGIACETLPCPCSTSTSGGGGTANTGTKQIRQRGRVVAVVDGDTIDVRLSTGVKKRVRLIGIDTPEVYGGVQCGGPQASRSLKKILPKGTRVRLVSDPSQARTDRYGRLLRYVTKVSTGKDVNRQQVFKGWARVYVYDNKPFNRVTSYRTALKAAKAAPRGIWKIC